MLNIKINSNKGLTLVEVLVVIGVMALIVGIVFGSFNSFRGTKSVSIDAETVVEILRQARNETLSSKNAGAYGVKFATSTMTIFLAPTYVAGTATNRDFTLSSPKTVLTLSLTGGGSTIVFNKLTGETSQNGTIAVSSSVASSTKTVTIYKTGLVESN